MIDRTAREQPGGRRIESPLVSVVVPTRDRSELLGRALRTVLWQDHVDLEVIVVDDASRDDTQAAVQAFRDDRIKYLRHDRSTGVSEARNRGLHAASAPWVAFLDDDDLWAPDKLESQMTALASTGLAWAYTGSVNITIGDEIIGGAPPEPPPEVARRISTVNLVPGGCSSVIARRDMVLEVGAFDVRLVNLADWDLWIRLAQRGPPAAVRRPLVGYRIHGGNASQDTGGMVTELDLIERRCGHSVDRTTFYRHLARVSRRDGRRRRAIGYYAHAAALGDPKYILSTFPRDVAEVLGESLRAWYASGRSGTSHPRPARARHIREWWAQAQPWLDRLGAEG